jgi:predicted Zn finger-like uncharacterized protein
MIVKCEQCQTKFKIPDDKVTEKGVKVRCTKCSHTFRVTREQGIPEAAAKAPPKPALDSADPFSKFGTGEGVPKDEQTRPGVFALGVEASRMPDLGRPVPPAPRPPTSASGAPSPFDFGSLTPPAPKPASAAPAPFDFSSLVSAQAPASSPPAAKPPSAPTRAPPSQGPAPSPFDFSALTAPPAPVEAPKPMPPPRTSAPARPIDAPAMSFDFSSLGPGPSAPTEQNAAYVPPMPARARPAAAPPAAAPPAGQATMPEMPALLGDLPPLPTKDQAPPPIGDDFFAANPFGGAATAQLAAVPADASEADARSALFDMSAAGKVDPAPRIEPAPTLPPEPPSMTSTVSSVMNVPKPPDPATERGRRVLGIVVNVLIAAVLVVGLVVVGTATVNEGKLDPQSIGTSLKSLLMPASPFPAEDISNGLYDTKMGRPVFFVRGVVANRTQAASRVKVKAEILDGATLVRSAEVVAGSPPTPEELNRLADVAELKTLMERSSSRAAALEAGGVAPFLVTFSEYPPDLKAFRVRVTALPDGAPTAAK